MLVTSLCHKHTVYTVTGKKPVEVFHTKEFDKQDENPLQNAEQKELTLHNEREK